MVDFGNIPQGASVNFVVVALLSDGSTTSLANAGISCVLTNDSDPSIGSATVNPDGTVGVLTGGQSLSPPPGAFHVDGGGFTDNATYNTVAAVTVTGIQIQPVAGLKIKKK